MITTELLLWVTLAAADDLSARQAGIAANLAFTASDGLASLQLKLASESGEPLGSAQPRVWIERRRSDATSTETPCEAKTARLGEGSLFAQADVDLNGFYLVTLNAAGSVSFIDPFIRFNRTKLIAQIPLPARGLDWAATEDRRKLVVTIPSKNALAVIDLATRKLATVIELPGSPSRLWLSPLGHQAFTGLDGTSSIAVTDLATRETKSLSVGGVGIHTFAASSDGRHLLVTSAEAGRIALVDTASVSVRRVWTDLSNPAAVTYSPATHRFYVASANSPKALTIDPQTLDASPMALPGTGVLEWRFEEDGRYALALRPFASRIHLFDASLGRFIAESETQGSQLSYSRGFAIVRDPLRAAANLFDLNTIRKGSLEPIALSIGRDFEEQPLGAIAADLAVGLPGGPFTAVASLADRTIVTYSANKIAGTHQTYSQIPVGLLAIPKGLLDAGPGTYKAATPMPGPGRYDVLVKLAQPAISFCFAVNWSGPAPAAAQRIHSTVVVEVKPLDAAVQPGSSLTVDFKILDAATKQPVAGIRDARFLLTRLPDWQGRGWLEERGNGIYSAKLNMPSEPGRYKIMVAIDSRMLSFERSPIVEAVVAEVNP